MTFIYHGHLVGVFLMLFFFPFKIRFLSEL